MELINRTGMVESLHAETAGLGLRTFLIEPGRFRTELLSTKNLKLKFSKVPDYEDASQEQLKALMGENGNQPGDPEKLANIVLDLVKNEGVARGRALPLRLPLGSDCWTEIKSKLERTTALMKEWHDVIVSTDILA